MKKLLTIFFLLWSICSFGQFGWSSLLSNQWVSFTDAQGSGILTKQSLPSIARLMTKSDCVNYLYVDASLLSGYASNQWVTKDDLYNARYSPTYYSYWLSYESYSSASEICNTYTLHCNTPVYSADSVLSVGSQLWSNTALTTPYTDLSSWRGLSQGSLTIAVTASSGNTLTGVADCSTLDYHMYLVSQTGYSSAAEACSYVGSSADTIYSVDAQLTASSTLYWDASLTMPYYDENYYNTYKWIHPISNEADAYSYYTGNASNVATSLSQCVAYSITIADEYLTLYYYEQDGYQYYTADSNTYDIVCNDDWITVSGTVNPGSGYFIIHVTENTGYEPRIGTISIKLGSLVVHTITITQGY